MTIVYICCAICSGPLTSFPTLVPLLIDSGVFSGPEQYHQLTLMYTLAVSIAAGLFFFIGVAYDWLGAQICGVVGAIFVSLGFFGMAAALKWQFLNGLLYLAFPWTFISGVLNSFSVFGFVWFFPRLVQIPI